MVKYILHDNEFAQCDEKSDNYYDCTKHQNTSTHFDTNLVLCI